MNTIRIIFAALLSHSILCANGLSPTKYYFFPAKAVTLDRDALAVCAPGGSVSVRDVEGESEFELTWSDSSIRVVLHPNNAEQLKADYGDFFKTVPESEQAIVQTAIQSKQRIEIIVSRAGFPSIIQSSRQVILLDKLNQLGEGIIFSYQGFYRADGSLIHGRDEAPQNYFYPPPKTK